MKIISYQQRAEFYDIELCDLDDKNLLQSLITKDTKTILEIPCGSGRNYYWLAKTGLDVTLGDICLPMVKQVQDKLSKVNFEHNTKAKRLNLFKLSRIPLKFDLILMTRESVQLFSKNEIASILKQLHSKLSSKGFLYLDFVKPRDNTEETVNIPKYISIQNNYYTLDFVKDFNSAKYKRYHRTIAEPDRLKVSFLYRIEKNGTTKRYKSNVSINMYTKEFLSKLFAKHDFKIIKVFGDYEQNPYSSNSPRMIFLLKKAYEEGKNSR